MFFTLPRKVPSKSTHTKQREYQGPLPCYGIGQPTVNLTLSLTGATAAVSQEALTSYDCVLMITDLTCFMASVSIVPSAS